MTRDAPLPGFLQDAIVNLVLAVQDDERGSVHHRATEARVALVAAIRRTVAAAVDVARLEARRTTDGNAGVHSGSCVGRVHDSLGCSCGVGRVNAEGVAYACRLPLNHDGDHHPNPCGHDGCTGLECLRAAPSRSEETGGVECQWCEREDGAHDAECPAPSSPPTTPAKENDHG